MDAVSVELVLLVLLVVLAVGGYTIVKMGIILWKLVFGPKDRPHLKEEQPKKGLLKTDPWTEPE